MRDPGTTPAQKIFFQVSTIPDQTLLLLSLTCLRAAVATLLPPVAGPAAVVVLVVEGAIVWAAVVVVSMVSGLAWPSWVLAEKLPSLVPAGVPLAGGVAAAAAGVVAAAVPGFKGV